MTSPTQSLLVDIKECIGCRACVAACKEIHNFPGDEDETELSAVAYTAMVEHDEDTYVRKLCMHCLSPSCVSVCPVGALTKTSAGPVVYDASICLGCRYCMVACPFNVPRYEWNAVVPSVRKCDMCVERLARGQVPACVEACPAEATICGSREEMLAEAHRRLRQSPQDYYPHVFGEHEVGGTSVLFLAPVSFAALGFKHDLGHEPLPDLTWEVLEKLPGVVTIGGACLLAVWWITHRREEVALAAAGDAPAAHLSPGGEEGDRS